MADRLPPARGRYPGRWVRSGWRTEYGYHQARRRPDGDVDTRSLTMGPGSSRQWSTSTRVPAAYWRAEGVAL